MLPLVIVALFALPVRAYADNVLSLTDADSVSVLSVNTPFSIGVDSNDTRMKASMEPGATGRTVYRVDVPEKGALRIAGSTEVYFVYTFLFDTEGVVVDNHGAHTSKETRAYLETVPGCLVFVLTPKHGSWPNLVESLFGKLARVCLKGIRVSSKAELVVRIYRYIDEVNAVPVVHHWKYKMDEVTV